MGLDIAAIFASVDLNAAKRVERLDEFEFFIETEMAQIQAHAIALALLGLAPSLSSRDRIEVTVAVDGEAASAGVNDDESRMRIGRLFDLGSDAGADVRFRLVIHKRVEDNALSVYDLDAFAHYLDTQPLKHVLDSLADRFDGHLKLACARLLKAGGSATLQFVPEGHPGWSAAPYATGARERAIALFKETSFSASLPAKLIPADFQLDNPIGHPVIDRFFARASAVLSAIYLCNNAELEPDNTLMYRLAGYKVLEESGVSVASLTKSHEVLSKIANWAYDAGGSTDKVGLARNVLSLHVASLRDLSDQPQILNAILSNYQIYLKDNVSAYLDVRNRMAELLLESTSKTHSLVESSLDSVRNGMLVVFTFVLTVVVVNGLKDTNTKVIFSAEYFWVVFIITVLCSIWIHHACKDVLVRFDYAVETTKQLLKDSYHNVLIADEVDQHTSATFVANRKHLKQQVRGYRYLWYAVSAVLLLTFAVGYVANYGLPYGNDRKPAADKSSSTQVPTPASTSRPASPESKPVRKSPLGKPQ